MIRLCTICVTNELEVCFDRRSRYVSAVLELCFDRVCLDPARCMIQLLLKVSSYRARVSYVSTVLEICSDRARGSVRPLLEVCFDRTRGMF